MDRLVEWGRYILDNQTYNDISLNCGSAGKLLLLKQMYDLELISYTEYKERYQKLTVKIRSLNKIGDMTNLGIFSGLSGVGIALGASSFKGDLYYQIINRITNSIIYLLNNENNLLNFRISIDLMNGIAGYAKILVHEHEHIDNVENTLSLILEFLVKKLNNLKSKVENKQEKIFLFPGHSVGIEEAEIYDLSISHGLCGVLSLLTDMYGMKSLTKKGFKNKIRSLAEEIIDFMEGYKIFWNDFFFWNDFLCYRNRLSNRNDFSLTWCRGMVGISSAIHKFYFLDGQEEKANAIKWNLLKIYNNVNASIWDNAECFCHGKSGILYFFNKYSLLENIKKEPPQASFFEQTLNNRINKFSLLNGILGEFLVYLCIRFNVNLDWDFIFGI